MDHSIVREQIDLHFTVGIHIIPEFPCCLLVFDDTSAPGCNEYLISTRTNTIGPRLVHGSILFGIDLPLLLISVIVAGSSASRNPDILAIACNRVDHIIGKSAVELGKGFEHPPRITVQSSQGPYPDITCKVAYIDGEDPRVGQSVLLGKCFELVILV